MQCDCLPLRHPQSPISEFPQHLYDILHDGPFISSCEKWEIIIVFWIVKAHLCESPQSVGALEHHQFTVPTCLHIHNRKYRQADFGFLTVNEVVSTTRCQGNQYREHSLVYKSQFQDFQNIAKYVHSQLSLENLVSWPTPY